VEGKSQKSLYPELIQEIDNVVFPKLGLSEKTKKHIVEFCTNIHRLT